MKPTVFFAAVLVLSASAAQAQQAPLPAGATVAFISGQRITSETNDGKAGQLRLQTLQQDRTTDLKAKQQALETASQEFNQLAPGAPRTEAQQKLLQQQADLQRATAQAQADLQALQRQIAADIQPKVRAALEQILKGTQIQLVLQQESAVVWSVPALDLTSAVIERMNASSGALPAPAAGAK